MSKLTLCDICHALIKLGDTKYILGINEVREEGGDEKPIADFTEFVRRYKQGFDRVQLYEVCEECKQILEHLFKMRKKERKKILEELNKLYEKNGNGHQEVR